MIEATCSACGTHNRIAETDVPAGAKFVTCASCKSRVPLPGAATRPIPTMPKLPTVVPPIPSIKPPAPKPPLPNAGPPAVSLGPAGAGAIPVPKPTTGNNEIIDLSDLPAPKRQSPLGVAPESKPAPRSGLSAALDADLPAPKAKAPASAVPPSASLDLDDIMLPRNEPPGVADLPAPKSRASADLPAPKSAPRAAAPPIPPGGDADLPAPKARPMTAPRAQPGQPLSLDLDLPAPREAAPGVSDLPAPKPQSPDLLQPKPGQTARGGSVDLPMPKPGGPIDLPAPKGFFDDLPQPARNQRPEPGEVAPKGFFDDLPQPAKGQKPGAQANEVAPLGFFDDLPQPAKGQRPGPAPTDDIAPKGFFDDLPQPATIMPPAPVAAQLPTPVQRESRSAIDLVDDPIEPIDLADEPQALELEGESNLPLASSPSSGSFDDLDLSAPSAAPGARVQNLPLDDDRAGTGIKIGTPKTPIPPKQPPERASLPSLTRGGPDEPLELEEPRETQSISQRLAPKPQRPSAEQKPIRKPVNRKLVLGILLGLVVAGGGGFMYLRHRAAQQERADRIDEHLARARKALASDKANRYAVATAEANEVINIDAANGAANAIMAEAAFAGALADGKNREARIAQGRKRIADALAADPPYTGPELERAQALSAILANPTGAIPKLKALVAKAPKDPTLALYLAWGYDAAGDAAEAIKAYDTATAAPVTKVLALLGRGWIKLDGGDVEGARADFDAVLAIDKANIPAQVGLAAALPAAQTQQQESDLLAILARKDVGTADPRAVVLAWVLAGDAAKRTSRLDAARERYRKALAIDKKSLAAIVGLAETELTDGKLEPAKAQIDQALVHAKDHAPALIAKANLALAEKRVAEAEDIVKQLEERKPPLPVKLAVRVGVVRGKVLEAKQQDDAAVEAYAAAAKLAGEQDLTPTMAAIAKLSAMAKTAAEAKDTAREEALKQRRDEMLGTLETAADKDPSVAFTLGVAYLQTGEAALAEPWLRKVLEARPADPDAMFQLAVAQRSLDRAAEAIALFEKAQAAAPERLDIGIELARTLEQLGKLDETAALYEKLLALPNVTPEIRAYAGLFYVRVGKLDKAGEQGKEILKTERDNGTAHYLAGEGALAAGNLDEARRSFTEAVSFDRSARHLDGLGRASESIAIAKKDLAMQDAAIRAYTSAIELDPKLVSSQLGLGRVYVARREMEKGIPPLLEANKLRAKDAETSYLLGRAYQESRPDKAGRTVALQWLQQSNALQPSADALYYLGELYTTAEINDGGAAAASYGAATRMAGEDHKKGKPLPLWYSDALYKHGRNSFDIGDEKTARSAWEKWLGTSPPPPMDAKRKEVERLFATSLRR